MTSDAETILANNPDVNGLYGVYGEKCLGQS